MPCSCRVAIAEWLAPDIVSVWLDAPEIARAVHPGQFVQVRVAGGGNPKSRIDPQGHPEWNEGPHPKSCEPYLRRPISVAQRSAGRIRLVFRVVGRGTALLAATQSGDTWDVIGPLGKPAQLPRDRLVLIAGGGIGVAPLLFLAEEIMAANDVELLLGAKHRQDLILRAEFRRLDARIRFATEDGSLGTKGLVTDLLDHALSELVAGKRNPKPGYGTGYGTGCLGSERSPLVFACGPRPMLKRVKELCAGVEAYAFWEERMGCGTGICYGCAVKSANSDSYIRFCQDGPVLNLEDIEL